MTDLPILHPLAAVADYLGVTGRTVKRWIAAGHLKAVRFGNRARVLDAELQRFARSDKVKTAAATVDTLLSRELVVQSAVSRGEALCGIYFLLDGDEIVYVGQSKNMPVRIHAHDRLREMSFDRYLFQPCSARLLLKVEAHYISAFRPRYNIITPPVEQLTDLDLEEIRDCNG